MGADSTMEIPAGKEKALGVCSSLEESSNVKTRWVMDVVDQTPDQVEQTQVISRPAARQARGYLHTTNRSKGSEADFSQAFFQPFGRQELASPKPYLPQRGA